MTSVTFEFLDSAIDDLYNTIGVKDNMSFYSVYSIYSESWIKWLCRKIAQELWLNVNLDIKYATWNNFKTTQLHTYSDWDSWICAQVDIPDGIGNYNFDTIRGYIISIILSPYIEKDNILWFSVVMAHELSHIVLHLIKHAQRENEYYTDLTAMMLWFNEIYNNWRKKTKETDSYVVGNIRHTNTSAVTYWYLDDIDFGYASSKIQFLLDQDKLHRDILRKRGDRLEKMIYKISKYITIFNKKLTKLSIKLWINSITNLQKYFDVTYIQKYETTIYKAREIINKINNLLIKDCKTKKWLDIIIESTKNIEIFIAKVNKEKKQLKDDVIILSTSKHRFIITKFLRKLLINIYLS